MPDRHHPDYYKEYYARSDKAQAKAKKQAEQQKADRHKEIESRPKCRICGEPFKGRAIGSPVTLSLGIHQTCDPIAWIREFRRLKK